MKFNEINLKDVSTSNDSEQAIESRNGQLGLDNLGNTCYMNAAIQCLSNIQALTSLFLECSPYIKATATAAASTRQQSCSIAQAAQQTLSMTYMRLMRDMWQRPAKIVSPRRYGGEQEEMVTSVAPVDLIRVIKLAQPMFRGCQQHDSMEFLTYLLDQMHEELKRPLPLHSPSQLLTHSHTIPSKNFILPNSDQVYIQSFINKYFYCIF